MCGIAGFAGPTADREAGGRIVSPGPGHGVMCVKPHDNDGTAIPELMAYEREILPEMQARMGPRSQIVKPIASTVFPNLSMLRGGSRFFRVLHPRGPDKTEVWSWTYTDKAAPPHIKEAFRLAGIQVFGPSGVLFVR